MIYVLMNFRKHLRARTRGIDTLQFRPLVQRLEASTPDPHPRTAPVRPAANLARARRMAPGWRGPRRGGAPTPLTPRRR